MSAVTPLLSAPWVDIYGYTCAEHLTRNKSLRVVGAAALLHVVAYVAVRYGALKGFSAAILAVYLLTLSMAGCQRHITASYRIWVNSLTWAKLFAASLQQAASLHLTSRCSHRWGPPHTLHRVLRYVQVCEDSQDRLVHFEWRVSVRVCTLRHHCCPSGPVV